MTFEEASSVALNAGAVLSAILNDWIVMGHVIYLMPVATPGEGDIHSPSVEVHVLPDLTAEAKMEIIHAVQPIVDTGVPVTVTWSTDVSDYTPVNTLH